MINSILVALLDMHKTSMNYSNNANGQSSVPQMPKWK